jgi:pimeloyl-ACP methyl ester carboxylesterase
MSEFVPWDSQPLEKWAERHAPGRFVDLGGRRTHSVVKGEGPPVVLVHGFNLDLNTWLTNVDALARQFTVYALDLWGSGFSTREPLDYWIHDAELLTDACFESLSRYQKIEGTTRATLDILRRDFFNTLDREIHALAGLDIPTLIVWGRHDRSVPLTSGQAMHRILTGSRLEVLDDAGHLPNFDRADRFNELVLEFLGGQA